MTPPPASPSAGDANQRNTAGAVGPLPQSTGYLGGRSAAGATRPAPPSAGGLNESTAGAAGPLPQSIGDLGGRCTAGATPMSAEGGAASLASRTSGPVGSGRRLVLVHGFTQTGRSWDPLVARWARAAEVITVDAPGHGDSSSQHLDLVAGAEALVTAGGVADYLGYSMGGRLALHAALAAPQCVKRLVLLGSTAGLDDPAERAARVAADEALAADLERDGLDAFLTRWLNLPLFARLPAEAANPADRRRNTVAGLASSLRLAGTGAQVPLWNRLGDLQMPVLVLAGEHDSKFAALAARLGERIGANAEVALIAGAGHAAHLERPAAFTDVVDDFFARTA